MTATLFRPPAGAPVRRRPRRWWALGTGLVLVVAALVWTVGFSPVLGVRTVTVRGAVTVPAASIRSAAAIARGTPLARLSTGAVRDRVQALPAIASVRVSVSYPSTVVISVVERSPVGYLRADAGTVLVDAAGVRFRNVPAPPPGLPRLDPSGAAQPTVLAGLAGVAAALTGQERAAVAVIEATGPDVNLTLTDGRRVIWGPAQRSPDKARLLLPLLDQPGHTIDLSDPDVVVTH